VRPVGRLARDWVPAQQSPQKQGSRPLFATASLKLSGHDATGYTRPYRDPSLARIVYSISKTLRYAQGGILAFFTFVHAKRLTSGSGAKNIDALAAQSSLQCPQILREKAVIYNPAGIRFVRDVLAGKILQRGPHRGCTPQSV